MTNSTSVEFCDTNVIVYAFGLTGSKWTTARHLLARLGASGDGALSVQVLQEFYATVTRKLAPPLAPEQARAIIEGLTRWRVVEPTTRDVLDAIANSVRWQVSFWDAMLLTTANKAGAGILWSEDLNHGQRYGRVTVQNPFL